MVGAEICLTVGSLCFPSLLLTFFHNPSYWSSIVNQMRDISNQWICDKGVTTYGYSYLPPVIYLVSKSEGLNIKCCLWVKQTNGSQTKNQVLSNVYPSWTFPPSLPLCLLSFVGNFYHVSNLNISHDFYVGWVRYLECFHATASC